jgi:hypothetical protein
MQPVSCQWELFSGTELTKHWFPDTSSGNDLYIYRNWSRGIVTRESNHLLEANNLATVLNFDRYQQVPV